MRSLTLVGLGAREAGLNHPDTWTALALAYCDRHGVLGRLRFSRLGQLPEAKDHHPRKSL
jgi:hypothetical protein